MMRGLRAAPSTLALARRLPALRMAIRPLSTAPVTSGATGVFPDAPSPLQEFSVVYTDRALNHMSEPFKKVMLDVNEILKEVGSPPRARTRHSAED